MIAGLRDATVTLLYPNTCRVCGEFIESWRDGVACATCWQATETIWEEHTPCVKCGLPLPRLNTFPDPTERRCGRCQELVFTRARSCGPYEGALRESVLWLKSHEHLAPRLRQLLLTTFAALNQVQASESVIPVPLHPLRLKARGFNQAEVLARGISAATGLYLDTTSLIRVKASDLHRAGMDAIARARSVRDAFCVHAPRLIENRAVLLVDDVMTSGATAHEISQTLLSSGARAVSVLTLARAASHFN